MFYLNFDTFLEYVEGIDIKKTGGMKTALLICAAYEAGASLLPALGSRTTPT